MLTCCCEIAVAMVSPWNSSFHGDLVSMVLCGLLHGLYIVAFTLHLVIMLPVAVKFASADHCRDDCQVPRCSITLEQMFYCNFLFNVFIFISDSSECDVPGFVSSNPDISFAARLPRCNDCC